MLYGDFRNNLFNIALNFEFFDLMPKLPHLFGPHPYNLPYSDIKYVQDPDESTHIFLIFILFFLKNLIGKYFLIIS